MAVFTDGDIGNTIGANTIGVSVALLLGGISHQQAYRYFVSFPKDRWQFKLLVTAIATFNIAHSAAISNLIYDWDVLQWGEATSPNSSPKGFSTTAIFSAVIISIVQLFYAYRIYIMTRSFVISGCILIGSMTQFITHITMAAYLFRHPHMTALSDIKVDATATMAACTIIDLIITITILLGLRRIKESHDEVKNVVRKIALLSIHTNGCATIMATTTMIVFIAYPSGWVNATYFTCVKLYIISLLAVLNARPIPSDLETTQAFANQRSVLFQETIQVYESEMHIVYVGMDELQPSSIIYLPSAVDKSCPA